MFAACYLVRLLFKIHDEHRIICSFIPILAPKDFREKYRVHLLIFLVAIS